MMRSRRGKADERYPREHNEEAADDYTAQDMMILGDDGESVLFIPLTPWALVPDTFRGKEREKMHLGVARVGEDSIDRADKWYVQDWPIQVRLFADYRAMRDEYLAPRGAGVTERVWEGNAVLKLVRDGAKGDQNTRYHLTMVGVVKPEDAKVIEGLTADAFAG